MNAKKYLLAVVAVFVAYSGLGYLIHEVLLDADYQPMVGTVLRNVDAFGRRLPFLYVGNLIFALALCLIYVQGYEPRKNWIGQGLRFGLIMALLLAPMALTTYVVYPVTGMLAVKWLIFGSLQIVITSLVAAGLYQTPA